MKRLLTLLALIAAPSFASLTPGMSTGNPYYPLTGSSRITYQVNKITGVWHPNSFQLDVMSRALLTDDAAPQFGLPVGSKLQPQTIDVTVSQCAQKFGNTPLFVARYLRPGQSFTPFNFDASVQDRVDTAYGIPYVGEAIAPNGVVHLPSIAKITMTPVAGQKIDVYSRIKASCASEADAVPGNPYFHWQYMTIAHYDTWGSMQDVWRTGLYELEGNNGNGVVYNYVFQRNVGMVHFWYGNLDKATNTVNGFEYWMIQSTN